MATLFPLRRQNRDRIALALPERPVPHEAFSTFNARLKVVRSNADDLDMLSAGKSGVEHASVDDEGNGLCEFGNAIRGEIVSTHFWQPPARARSLGGVAKGWMLYRDSVFVESSFRFDIEVNLPSTMEKTS